MSTLETHTHKAGNSIVITAGVHKVVVRGTYIVAFHGSVDIFVVSPLVCCDDDDNISSSARVKVLHNAHLCVWLRRSAAGPGEKLGMPYVRKSTLWSLLAKFPISLRVFLRAILYYLGLFITHFHFSVYCSRPQYRPFLNKYSPD